MSLMSLSHGRERRWRRRVGSRRKEKAQCRAGIQSREQLEGNRQRLMLASSGPAPTSMRLPAAVALLQLKIGKDANARGTKFRKNPLRSLSPDRSAARTENRNGLPIAKPSRAEPGPEPGFLPVQ